jgi:hypothetical protein
MHLFHRNAIEKPTLAVCKSRLSVVINDQHAGPSAQPLLQVVSPSNEELLLLFHYFVYFFIYVGCCFLFGRR